MDNSIVTNTNTNNEELKKALLNLIQDENFLRAYNSLRRSGKSGNIQLIFDQMANLQFVNMQLTFKCNK